MTNNQQIHNNLKVIDDEVVRILSEYIPEHKKIAVDTYQFGLLVRELAIEDIQLRERVGTKKQPIWEMLIRSEAFVRLLVLLVIILFKCGSAPILRLLTKIRG
jgi:hypothetical protein